MNRGLSQPAPATTRRPPSRSSQPRHDSMLTNSRISSTPNSTAPPPTRHKSCRSRSPTLEDFLHPDHMPPPAPANRSIRPAEQTLFNLEETRTRFLAQYSPAGEHKLQSTIQRGAVLDILTRAIDTLRTHPSQHERLTSEATRKIKVILGIITADPDDPVFTRPGQLLKPLEPHYANPRIPEISDAISDDYAHRAQSRLEAWGAEGWPDAYPEKAVRAETRRGGKLVGDERRSNKAVRARHMMKSNEDLGGVVEKVNREGEVAGRGPAGRKRWSQIGAERPEGGMGWDEEDGGDGGGGGGGGGGFVNIGDDDWT